MIDFVILAFLYMTPDGERYQEVVTKFPTVAACEKAAGELRANLALKLPGEVLVVHVCKKPRALSAADV